MQFPEIIVIRGVISRCAHFAYVEIRYYNSLKTGIIFEEHISEFIIMPVCCCAIGCQNVFSIYGRTFQYSTLQFPTEPILRQQCTVAVVVVRLLNLLWRLTLSIFILIVNTNIRV